MIDISWVFTALAIVGKIYYVYNKIEAAILWAIADLGLTVYNLSIDQYAQAFLFSFYFLCNLIAIRKNNG